MVISIRENPHRSRLPFSVSRYVFWCCSWWCYCCSWNFRPHRRRRTGLLEKFSTTRETRTEWSTLRVCSTLSVYVCFTCGIRTELKAAFALGNRWSNRSTKIVSSIAFDSRSSDPTRYRSKNCPAQTRPCRPSVYNSNDSEHTTCPT